MIRLEELDMHRRQPRQISRALVLNLCVTCLTGALWMPSYAANYGQEDDDADCTADIDMAHYYGCLAQKRDEQRAMLDVVVNRVVATARSGHHPESATDIRRAELDWLKWMVSECN